MKATLSNSKKYVFLQIQLRTNKLLSKIEVSQLTLRIFENILKTLKVQFWILEQAEIDQICVVFSTGRLRFFTRIEQQPAKI